MKLRKALIFVLCVVLALPLVACSKNGASGEGPKPGSKKEYTVTFDVGDEAKAAGVSNPNPITVNNGQSLRDANKPFPSRTWKDHKFDGWYEGKDQFTRDTKLTRDWHVTAKWTDNSQQAAIAEAYEKNISNWDEAGHLYIHYKRAGHNVDDQGKTYNGTGPEYDDEQKAISSTLYGDWGLWLWPTNGEKVYQGTTLSYEGIVFYPSKIDESGAVYDILLNHTYTKGGWDENTLSSKNLNVNYVNQSTGVLRDMKMQLFRVSSRKEDGFWKNDGGNVTLNNSKMIREKGSYHWFVSEGNVGYGSPTFSTKEVVDVYADDTNHDKHPTDKTKDINSNKSNKSKYNISDVPVQDYATTGVGYQIFIASFRDGMKDDSFTEEGKGMGDLRGVIDALDEGYFTDLNVNVLWLTPFQSSTNYHGYDIKDYYSVDPRFGTIEDYRELLYKAHQKGIKVVMDFVLNHTAENNPWYVKSVNLVKETKEDGSEIDYRNFYNWITKAQYDSLHECTPESKKKDGHWCAKDQWYEDSHGYYFYSSFGSSMPELNYDYQPVRDAILDVCNYWMSFGLDGFRLDAVKHIYMKNETEFADGGAGQYVFEETKTADTDPYTYDMTRNMNFWREFNYKLKTNYPNAFLVGENLDGDPKNVEQFYEGMDSQFDFNSYYDAGRALTQSDDSQYSTWSGVIKAHLKQRDGEGSRTKGYEYYNANYINGQFTSNHDLPRARDRLNALAVGSNDKYRSFFNDTGTEVEISEGKTVTVYDDYSTTPTKTANTASRAERSDALLRLYYAYLMTTPGIAWIYNGDELGMTGLMNIMIKEGKATNASAHEDRVYRQPMKWYDNVSLNASYDIGFNNFRCELVGLNTTEYVHGYDYQKTHDDSIYAWMRTLTAVRNAHPELINGRVKEQYTSIANGTVSLSAYTVEGKTGTTKVYISTGGNYTPSGNVYASWSSGNGKYSVTICKG